MTDFRFAAVILSAGLSSRLGQFKPLLNLGGRSFLEHLITRYQLCGVTDIRVIAGHRADEVMEHSFRLGAAPVLNPDYESGMWSSVVCGVSRLSSSIDGFFIHPVDIPLVRRQTLRDLMAAFQRASIIYPTFQQERGHPPLISEAFIPNLLQHDGRGGLSGFLSGHENQAIEIPTADRFILKDIDEPADYQWARACLDQYDIPSIDECIALMRDKLQVSNDIQRHCRAVAGLAQRIGKALVEAGCMLDIDLIVSAALVHDLARHFPNHASAGATWLRKMDFPRLADIVHAHMDFPVMPGSPVSEAEVVFLADKMTDGDQMVDLETRYRNKLSHYRGNSHAKKAVVNRMAQAMTARMRVEQILGRDILSIR